MGSINQIRDDNAVSTSVAKFEPQNQHTFVRHGSASGTNISTSSLYSDGACSMESLPLEILQEIFLHCSSSTPRHPELVYHSIFLFGLASQVPPLILTQVCRSWRYCALSLPNLWTSLDVYVSMGKARPPLSLAALWLTRSGALPLLLSLHQQNESSDNRVAAGEILDLYKLYTQRWKDIHLDLTGPRYCRLLTLQQKSAPVLERFRMQTSHLLYEEEEKDIFGIFAFVPNLAHLHVSRIPDINLLGESSVPIPWSQLVSLSLDYVPSVGTALRILLQCRTLKDCSVKIDAVNGPLPCSPVLHNLTSLELSIGNEQVSAFLMNVRFSALTHLTIYVRGPLDQYRWPQREFGAFLEYSGCYLSHFEIHDAGMRFDEFADCLSNPFLQALESIVVEGTRDWTWDPFVTDFAVDLLTCPLFKQSTVDTIVRRNEEDGIQRERTLEGRACHLPNLEALTFRGSCLWTADGAIADMIESRWRFHCQRVRRLRRVRLDLLSSHVEDMRRLKEFCNEGLEADLLFR